MLDSTFEKLDQYYALLAIAPERKHPEILEKIDALNKKIDDYLDGMGEEC